MPEHADYEVRHLVSICLDYDDAIGCLAQTVIVKSLVLSEQRFEVPLNQQRNDLFVKDALGSNLLTDF